MADREDRRGFGRLQLRLGVADPEEPLLRTVPVYYYVFDVLYARGLDICSLPYGSARSC